MNFNTTPSFYPFRRPLSNASLYNLRPSFSLAPHFNNCWLNKEDLKSYLCCNESTETCEIGSPSLRSSSTPSRPGKDLFEMIAGPVLLPVLKPVHINNIYRNPFNDSPMLMVLVQKNIY